MLIPSILYISLLSFYQVTGSYLTDTRYNDDIKKDRWIEKTEYAEEHHKNVKIVYEDGSFNLFKVGVEKLEKKIINENKYSYTEETTQFFVDNTSHKYSVISYDKAIDNRILSSSFYYLIRNTRDRHIYIPPSFPPIENDTDYQNQEVTQRNTNRYRQTITQNSCCTIS